MPLRAVFLDFDGLILDTEWPEVEAWSEMFREHGHVYADDVWKGVIGRGAEQEAVRAEDLLSKWTGRPARELEAEYRVRKMAKILLQPVLPGVIARLAEAAKLGLIVVAVSSSKREWVEGHLRRLSLWPSFLRSFCSDDVARTKPFPDLYLLALSTLGLAANEAVVFEDSPNGVAAARAAGIRVIAVPNRLTAQLDLSAADAVVDSLEMVPLSPLLVPTMSGCGGGWGWTKSPPSERSRRSYDPQKTRRGSGVDAALQTDAFCRPKAAATAQLAWFVRLQHVPMVP
ncbi:MAG: HAD family hydrolase [Fimbriimonadaceae bacterium]